MTELRRRPGSIAGEAFSVLCGVGIPAAITFAILSYRFDSKIYWLIGIWAGFSLLPLSLLAFFRWRSRLVLGSEGIAYLRSAGRPGLRLEWGQIREIFFLGSGELKIRGPAGSIRLTQAYRGHQEASRLIRQRSRTAIRARLEEEYRERGAAVFSAPWPAMGAHALYLFVVLLLACVSTYLVWQAWRLRHLHSPLWSVAGGSTWLFGLWQARRAASWLGGGVTLRPSGLTVRRLDGEHRIGWEDVLGAAWGRKGGLEVTMVSGRRLEIPASIANLDFLRRMIEERLGRGSNPPEPEGVPL